MVREKCGQHPIRLSIRREYLRNKTLEGTLQHLDHVMLEAKKELIYTPRARNLRREFLHRVFINSFDNIESHAVQHLQMLKADATGG